MNLRLYFIQQNHLFTQWGMLVWFHQWNKNKLNRDNTELYVYVVSELTNCILTCVRNIKSNSTTRTLVNNIPQRSGNTLGASDAITNFFFFYKYIKKQKVSKTSIMM